MPGSHSSTWTSQLNPSNYTNQDNSSRTHSWVSDEYPWYSITWEKLKAWLEKSFGEPPEPHVQTIAGSNYQFKVPHKLTEAERASIKKEHDRPLRKRSTRAVSPGG